MARIASFGSMPEAQVDRLIKRIGLILVLGTLVFAGFYIFDRWRLPAPSMVDRTIASLEAAVRDNPADFIARGQLGDAYLVARRYTEAIAVYDAVLTTGQADQLAYFGRARAYQAMGDLAAAKADFQAVIDIARTGEMAHVDPMMNAAFYGLGAIALDEGKPADAIQYLSAAIAIKRADADAMNLLGAAYVRNNEPEKAIEPLRKAIAFVPIGWSEPYTTLAQAYEQTGDAPRAEWAWAMADLSEGRTAAAETRLLAIVDGPIALEAAIGLALLHERGSDMTAAEEWYRKVLVLDPENPTALLGLQRTSLPDATGLPALPAPGAGGGTDQ
jgi:tetratricopeptide (TPR) repeat protein